MREALSVIAEIRDSERLRQFLLSGQDRESVSMFKELAHEPEKNSWGHQSGNQSRFPKRPQSAWEHVLPQFVTSSMCLINLRFAVNDGHF